MVDTTAPTVELDLNGTWTDITSYVYYRGMINIGRGRSDESSQAQPSTCQMTLNNRDGRFSPRNPEGPYYGSIGRNTPLRVSVNGGLPYLNWPGVAGARATTPDAAALDITGDIDIRVELELDSWFNDSTTQGILGKYTTTGNQRSWLIYLTGNNNIALRWSPDGTLASALEVQSETFTMPPFTRRTFRVTLDVDDGSGNHVVNFYTGDDIHGPWTQLGATVTTAGTTSIFSSTAITEMGELSAISSDTPTGKVYKAEVRDGIIGTIVANPDFTAQTAGATSFADSAGRTWSIVGGASISDKKVRFTGEVASWPVKWDLSGNDVWVEVEADGIMRRMGQGASPLFSPLRRSLTTADPIAYWPMEDGSDSTQASSPLLGIKPMKTQNFSFSSNSTEPGSDALPTVVASDFLTADGIRCTMSAKVPVASTNAWRVEFLFYLPANVAGLSQLLEVWVNNSSDYDVHRIYFNPTNIRVISSLDGGVVSSPLISITSSTLAGHWYQCYLYMSSSAGTTNYGFGIVNAVTGVVQGGTGSYSGTAGNISKLSADFNSSTPETDLQNMAVGHYAVFDTITDSAMSAAMNGHSGETPTERIDRLASEESFTAVTPFDTTYEYTMGPQTSNTILSLLQEAEDVDQGILSEPRDAVAVAYRDLGSMYNRDAVLTLDYSQHELSDSLNPADDDRYTRNDITISRTNGSSERQTLSTGALSTQAPPSGVGTYTESLTIPVETDDQLPYLTGWRLHLGTVDEARYPDIRLNLRHSTFTGSVSMMDAALKLNLGDRITITNLPSWMPPGDIDVIVVGMQETLGIRERDLVITCAPQSPYNVAITDEDAYGRADTAGAELSTDATSVATSMSVATTSGPLWTTDAGDFPFDATVGGEVVTVTNITGASSPQTFTVTRSVNGVVKAQTTGTTLSLTYPAYTAL